MHRTELLIVALGASAFALTFHTDSSVLRLFLAVVAVVATVRVQTSSRALWSWALGTASILGCYCWMVRIAPFFFHVDSKWGAPIWIAFSLYEGSIFLLARLLSDVLKSKLHFFALPVAWFALEMVFPHIVPWHWANLFLEFQPLVLSVGLLGAPAFTLLFFLVSVPIISSDRGACEVAAAALCVLLLCSAIQARAIADAEAHSQTVRLGIVQSNLDPARDFRPEKRFQNVDVQRRLSEPLLSQKIDLLIWPESGVHFDYPDNLKRLAPGSAGDPLPDSDVPILFGTQTRLKAQFGEGTPKYYFSSLMLGRDDVVAGRYDKHILLPFSESVPFMEYIPPLKWILPTGYDLQPGTGSKSIALPSPVGANVAVSICYEDLFPSAFSGAPANSFLLSQANDAWFLDSAAAEQHYYLSRLRAIEQGKYFVRVTTNGVSAVVSPYGEEILRLPSFVPATAAIQIPLL